MSKRSKEDKSPPEFPRDAEQARVDRDLTRQELGETVQELAHKVNVPEQARQQARHTADELRERLPQPVVAGTEQLVAVARQNPLATAAAVVVLVILVRKLKGGRKSG
ncbi:Protein of unknown function [Amycolatopsis marina]|uniref:DUF3618 domain-containing protein n=1 Tax=Amycolatopsis marina TaxID=490629 RepID=A0A1I0Y1M8_9PSEU|nr:DUF3618 domain-containing protein [Amycolatopsis marina]SFB06368.1 Protein of unknown function [Amycolatopsis marina]